jgi:serine/threonine-protein kinase
MSAAPDPLGLVGQTIDELRFDLCVDTEGEGLVYRGKLHGREDPVAIKCLSLSRLGGADVSVRAIIAARFNEETKILRRLADGTHDIVHCITDGRLAAPTTGETVQYQVLEWLDGRTLEADLDERRSRKMPGRSLRETLDLVESAALAIGHAHSQGIVHRDLQPANMMLVRQRGGLRLKVLNFGLAKNLNREAALGTDIATFDPEYAAPEVLASSSAEIGPWSDVWSLAILMLEVLSGQKVPNPQGGSIRASALGLQLPAPIEELLASATALDPQARPAEAKVFWTTMRELHQANAKPVANADALAATAIDADAAAAIQRVRAMTAGGPPQSDKGTMLMAQAPPQVPIQEGPLAGTKPIAIPSPLASSIGGNMKSPLGPGPTKGTAPMPATPPAPQPTMPAPVPAAPPPPQVPIDLPAAGAPKSNTLVVGIIGAVLIGIAVVALAILYVVR